MPPSTSTAPGVRIPPIAIMAALTYFAVFLFFPQTLNDGDTYWHISAGNWMLSHGAIPRTDPFSYSFFGKPWVAHEWLAELLMALAFRLAGWSGVLILCGAAAGLTLGLLAYHLERWTNRLGSFLLVFVAGACIAPSLLARPHILTLPLLELWTAGLLIARGRSSAPSWLLLPVMVLWANLHGSFIFGLALLLPLALEAAAEDFRNARRWSIFFVAAVLATLINPHFWHGLVFPFQLMGMASLSRIGEWQPVDFHHLQPIEVALFALLYVTWSRGLKLPPIRILILIGLLFLAFQHTRHQMIAGVVGTLVFAASVARPRETQRVNWLWIPAGIAGLLLLASLRLAHPAGRRDEIADALAHLPPGLSATPVFNDYGFGANLIFDGIRPFIDSRADMYGDGFLELYSKITRPDGDEFQRAAQQYGFRWAILSPGQPLVAVLDHVAGWHRVYAGKTAVVYARDAAMRDARPAS